MPSEYKMIQAVQNRWPVLKTDGTPGFKKVALDRPVCIVGARSRVHLPLPSQLISKAHAVIIHESDGIYLRDLASRNKTFVNNRAVREVRLRDDDVVRFGPFSFRCHSGFSVTADEEQGKVGELRVVSPRGATRVLPLTKQTFLIGCRYSCDLMLTGDEIGLAHAILFEREGKRFIRDLTSPSGTLLNGSAVREQELNAGDEIRIGTSRITYNSFEGPVAEFSAADAAAEHPASLSPDQLMEMPAGRTRSDDGAQEVGMPWEDSPPMVFEMKPTRRTEGE
jgi:pSer/pThr/pTyr-binding forkhead associated (FHA) protein